MLSRRRPLALAAAVTVTLGITGAVAPGAAADPAGVRGGVAAPALRTPLPPAGPVALPAGVTRAEAAAARAAFDRLSPVRREAALREFRDRIGPAIRREYRARTAAGTGAPGASPRGTGPTADSTADSTAGARPSRAEILSGTGAARPGTSTPALTFGMPPAATRPAAPGGAVASLLSDDDLDGFDEGFEAALADGFTPVYHVSGGEPDRFATFADGVPQSVTSTSAQPISYYRVQPLGFGSSGGTELGLVRIDYLTLWDHDSGLALDGSCEFNLVFTAGLIGLGIGAFLHLIGSHDIDNERSAVLVAAPTPAPGTFNPDPGAYRLYSLYTAAHEGTWTDQSGYVFYGGGPGYGAHVGVALSRSKHATYPFNPAGLPLLPGWVLDAALAEIDFQWQIGWIDDIDREIYRGIAFAMYFSCVVEGFSEQGGQFAGTRINVGEPDVPINGSHFIWDDRLYPKLAAPVF